MTSVARHYAAHLAPIYVWMAGGVEAALAVGTQDVATLVPGQGLAVDLGAGFGMHAIPLARAGYEVLAVDSSPLLLATLREQSVGLPIHAIESDLLDFRRHLASPANVILCMGDTLTHLASLADVQRLCHEVAAALAPGGTFMATFRDYSMPATGDARFIPVRSDSERILTCFLEATPEYIVVHDLLHERVGSTWQFKVSSYRKLPLAPVDVERMLRQAGLTVRFESGPRGMVRLTAESRDGMTQGNAR